MVGVVDDFGTFFGLDFALFLARIAASVLAAVGECEAIRSTSLVQCTCFVGGSVNRSMLGSTVIEGVAIGAGWIDEDLPKGRAQDCIVVDRDALCIAAVW